MMMRMPTRVPLAALVSPPEEATDEQQRHDPIGITVTKAADVATEHREAGDHHEPDQEQFTAR